MNTQLLALLRCPETKGVLRTATPAELEQINVAIRNSAVRNRNGELISELLEDCVICDSAGLYYPVRDGLPLMLTGEAFDTPR
ncbi:MAG TPA: Trm112 family protein [Chthoniobacterales bacterium]